MDDDERRLTPEAAFDLLGDPTRLGILRALWDADGPRSFTALRRAADVDDSGRFNYHLGRLTGPYVAEVDGGYALTSAGEFVVGAIVADAIDQRPQLGTVTVDGRCPHCGGGLEATFDEVGTVRCRACEAAVMSDAFPPAGGLDRTPDEIARAFDAWLRHRAVLAWRGVCPRCAGPVESTFLVPEDGSRARVEYACAHCRHEGHGPLVAQLLEHPAVLAAYWRRGVDLSARPYWERRALFDDVEETVAERDPLRLSVRFAFEDGALTLTVDEDGDVVDVEGG